MVEVGLGLGWSKEQLLATFRSTPQKEMQIYFSLASALTPRWGGSWDLVEAFAKDARESTRLSEGRAMYARIYVAVSGGEAATDPNVFKYSLANWQDIKDGFDDMMNSYPHSSFNLNEYAAFACMANDKHSFENLRFRIGKSLDPSRWPSGYSFDLCVQKFSSSPL